MPPAFILSHDQTLKFMSPANRSGIPRSTSPSQGAALHNIIQTTAPVQTPKSANTKTTVHYIWNM
jgi:hypothetical protein